MSSSSALSIDALRACRDSAHYERELSAEQLPRLAEHGITVLEPIIVRCDFYRDGSYKPFVDLSVSGKLEVDCQRCCEPMLLAVSSEQTVVLLVSEAQDEQNFAPEFEPVWLEEGEYFPLAQVVEDEILLSLPTAPLHDPEECSMKFDEPLSADDLAEGMIDEAIDEVREHPFAALAALKSNDSDN